MMGKNAKSPDRTGMRCIICYAWEVKFFNIKKTKAKASDRTPNDVKIDHEIHCPDYRA